jgi:uncharacterized protein YndB with AHSA1/START domain
MTEERVERSIDIEAPPAAVWPFLTTPAGLAAWYSFDGAVIEAREGGRIEFHWVEHGTYVGRVVRCVEATVLAYRIAALPDVEPSDTNSTLVTITLQGADSGCRVLVEQTGFEALTGKAAEASTPEIEDGGWSVALDTLRSQSEGRSGT